MKKANEIKLEFDNASKSYYATLIPPAAIGSGKTALKALKDLRRTACHGINTVVNMKSKYIIDKEGI